MVPESGPQIILRQAEPGFNHHLAYKDGVYDLVRQLLKTYRVEFDDISDISVGNETTGDGRWKCTVSLDSSVETGALEIIQILNRDGKCVN